MLTTKLVIRLLDADGVLLGWAEALGEARGDGIITVAAPTLIAVEEIGRPCAVSVHWCDVNVEIRQPIEHPQVVFPGQAFTIPAEWAAIVCGKMPSGLPPVTVRSPVRIEMLPGAIGAKGTPIGG